MEENRKPNKKEYSFKGHLFFVQKYANSTKIGYIIAETKMKYKYVTEY